MKCFNQVCLIGHLADIPQSKQTSTGKLVVSFPLVTNEVWLSKTGEKKSKVNFHRIIAWEKLGQISQKYLRKGSPIFLTGRLSNNTYQDKNGVKHFTTEIIADDLNILSFKEENICNTN